MTLDNDFNCDTLELNWHDNERGKSCTAPGVDRGRVWWSPSLKRLVVRYEDRNGRKDVLVHNANFAADEGDHDGDGDVEVTQIHGCTAVGKGYGEIKDRTGDLQWGILASVKTIEQLIASLDDGTGSDHALDKHGFAAGYHEVEITYSWAEGCAP